MYDFPTPSTPPQDCPPLVMTDYPITPNEADRQAVADECERLNALLGHIRARCLAV